MHEPRRHLEQDTVTRRTLLKLGGAGLATGLLLPFTSMAATNTPEDVSKLDIYIQCMSNCMGDSTNPLLRCALLCLPELQVQPRPVSQDSLAQRINLANQLKGALKSMSVEQIIPDTFPMTVRYPAWLATAISLELFELQLEHGPLPAFELNGIAMEHVLPFMALIDQAAIPLCDLLHHPGQKLSIEIEKQVAKHIEQLRGRLVLLGDKTLISIAEAHNKLLSLGRTPVLLHLRVNINDDLVDGTFIGQFENEQYGDLLWSFTSTTVGWLSTVHKDFINDDLRAIDKVVTSMLIGKSLLRCSS